LGPDARTHGPDDATGACSGLDGQLRTYTVYLPLYNGVNSLKIGVPATVRFIRSRRVPRSRCCFTARRSCTGRVLAAGLAIPAILGRRFHLPAINLGFSGNGRMDPEVVELLAELDPAVYCIDCLPNLDPLPFASEPRRLCSGCARHIRRRRSYWSRIVSLRTRHSCPSGSSFIARITVRCASNSTPSQPPACTAVLLAR